MTIENNSFVVIIKIIENHDIIGELNLNEITINIYPALPSPTKITEEKKFHSQQYLLMQVSRLQKSEELKFCKLIQWKLQ